MQLSEHFTLDELIRSDTANRRGINNYPSDEIIEYLRETANLLEDVRLLLKRPINVTSGYRCPDLNVAIGGSRTSSHMNGMAADFTCPSYGSPFSICQAIIKDGMVFDQLIHEFNSWVHISWSPNPRQQVLTINNSGTRSGLYV